MTLLNSTISSNSVTAGNGGDGGSGGSPAGVGGIGGNGYIGVAGAVALQNEAASILYSTLAFNSVALASGGSGGAAGPGGTPGTNGSAGSATGGGVDQLGGSVIGQSTIFADNTAGSAASDYLGAITASGCLFGTTSARPSPPGRSPT